MLNSGWIAVVPQTGLHVNQWFGYGWQIVDPNSGAAGYLIAGYLTIGSIMATGGGILTTIAEWVLEVHHLHAISIGVGFLGLLLVLLGTGFPIFGPVIAEAILASWGYTYGLQILGYIMFAIGIIAAWKIWVVPPSSNYIRRRWYAYRVSMTSLS